MLISVNVRGAAIETPLREITLEDISQADQDYLSYLEHESVRQKRSDDMMSMIKEKISHGIEEKIGHMASASGHFSGSKHHHDHYDHGEDDTKMFDFWDLQKSILHTLLQAVKAIKGGLIAIKGQLIKGSGYLVSAKGKLLTSKGEAITNMGKHIAASASLVHKPSHHSHHSDHHTGPSEHSGPEIEYGHPPSSSGFGAPSGHAIEYHHPPPHLHGPPPSGFSDHKFASFDEIKDHLPRGAHQGIIILKKIPKGTKDKHKGNDGAHSSLDTHKPDSKPEEPSSHKHPFFDLKSLFHSSGHKQHEEKPPAPKPSEHPHSEYLDHDPHHYHHEAPPSHHEHHHHHHEPPHDEHPDLTSIHHHHHEPSHHHPYEQPSSHHHHETPPSHHHHEAPPSHHHHEAPPSHHEHHHDHDLSSLIHAPSPNSPDLTSFDHSSSDHHHYDLQPSEPEPTHFAYPAQSFPNPTHLNYPSPTNESPANFGLPQPLSSPQPTAYLPDPYAKLPQIENYDPFKQIGGPSLTAGFPQTNTKLEAYDPYTFPDAKFASSSHPLADGSKLPSFFSAFQNFPSSPIELSHRKISGYSVHERPSETSSDLQASSSKSNINLHPLFYKRPKVPVFMTLSPDILKSYIYAQRFTQDKQSSHSRSVSRQKRPKYSDLIRYLTPRLKRNAPEKLD